MAIKQIQIVAPILLPVGASAQATVPTNTTYRLARTVFSNPTGTARTVTAFVVPPAGAPGASNQVINAQVVPAGGTYVSPELAGLVLSGGWSLQCQADAASAVVIVSSGTLTQ